MDSEYVRALTNRDVCKALNIDRSSAYRFLKMHGTKVGGIYIIPRNVFATLRMDGTVMNFMKELEERRVVFRERV